MSDRERFHYAERASTRRHYGLSRALAFLLLVSVTGRPFGAGEIEQQPVQHPLMSDLPSLIQHAVSRQWDIAPRILLHLNPEDAASLCGRIHLPAHIHVVPDPSQAAGTFVLRPASRVYA